ncbi:MAG TPA: bifunctional riboflavin kinase/FAD synthetase [Bacteroidales bacterium]
MKVYENIDAFPDVKNPVLTIGTFDGVHIGHQAIFNKMKEEAAKIGGETVVITFYPHPRIVLGLDNSQLRFINRQNKKIELLKKSGIDHLIVIKFTKEFSLKSSEEFFKDLVIDIIKPAIVVIGYDHHFGKNREGNFDLLEKYSEKYNFKLIQVPAQSIDEITVSSSKIRKLLEAGNVKEANRLLGYVYSITGKVVKGKSIGKDIGFPTANIETGDEYKLIAAVGVYACLIEYKGKVYKGMSNIGFRPTIDHGALTIEVNIFDFDQQIYDEEITIFFVERLRNEKKFESLDALVEQLHKDKEHTLTIL